MSIIRFLVNSDSIPEVEMYPTWDGKVEFSREKDGVFFRPKLVGDIQFKGDEYNIIAAVPDCEPIYIIMEEQCGEFWTQRWYGKFTTYDITFDIDKCLATVSPENYDFYYDCTLDKWDIDTIISLAGAVVECRQIAARYEGGLNCCSVLWSGGPPPSFPVCSVPPDMCYDSTYETATGGASTKFTSCFHRVVGIGTATDPPISGTDWVYLSGVEWWRCPDVEEINVGVFDQGRNLSDVLEYLVSEMGCGLSVNSHFFGINAIHAAPPSNIAYDFAAANYQNIQIHQKSDIKRPYSTDPAQSFVWKMSLKKLLEDFETMLQVFWKIDTDLGQLIIEHISYFEAGAGFDVTDKNIKRKYGKREEGSPNVETFKWVDASATFTTAHEGYPISYGDCGNGRVERKVNYFSNDVYYISEVANAEEIADSGFCLIATEEIDSAWQPIDGNNPLGWVAIHENLFRHNRYFSEGTLNDVLETFLTTQKTRELEPFKITTCCDDGFDPANSIETSVGTAIVKKAIVNYFAGRDTNLITIESNI